MTNHETGARSRYLLFSLPFVLAFIVWLLYPSLVGFLLFNVLKYPAASQPLDLIWSLAQIFFYTWYVFFTIGLGGLLVVAAWMWRQHPTLKIALDYPTISLIVPAYNEEQNISRCINDLFNCAIRYRGPSEIIVIDDGSEDNTFDRAWSTISSEHEEFPNIRTRVVRHTANLGMAEAIRTGANKAVGDYAVIVEAGTFLDSTALTELIDYMRATQATALTGCANSSNGKNGDLFVILQPLESVQDKGVLRRVEALGRAATDMPCSMGLYKIEVVRQLLNEDRVRVPEVRQRNRQVPSRFLGAVVDLIAVLSLPFLFWFAPDRVLFVLGLSMFLLLLLTIGLILQALALRFAFNQYGYKRLLWYTKLSYIFGIIDIPDKFKNLVKQNAFNRTRTSDSA